VDDGGAFFLQRQVRGLAFAARAWLRRPAGVATKLKRQ
jgi:hypothetical protein